MRYYYFDPIKKQYYFPESFKNYPLFLTFYQSYTLKGKLLWKIWSHSLILRKLFVDTEIEKSNAFVRIKNESTPTSILAINKGTKGIEQKTTILGVDSLNNTEFFIKYAETDIARSNVNNEGEILAQLKHLGFVPQIEKHIRELEYSLIQTNVLKGVRVSKQEISTQLLEVLIQLSEQKIETKKQYATELKTCFAHGDFCPWNMMLNNGALKIYDWEMAGIYPLGYDLFTYLFQTTFLLSPNIKSDEILNNNKMIIESYFKSHNINSYMKFLCAFADLKITLEKEKNNTKLLNKYIDLKYYLQFRI